MRTAIVLSLALAACAPVPPPMPNVGSSERVPSKTMHLRLQVEDLEGAPVAATETAVQLLSPSTFSARSREGGEVEVEVFLESDPKGDPTNTTAPDRYVLTMKLHETSDRGQQVSWRPSLALVEDTESLSTVAWGSAGRRIRVMLSEKELPAEVAEVATAPQPSTEAPAALPAPPDNADPAAPDATGPREANAAPEAEAPEQPR